jgi:hypothetical protein
MIGLKHVSPGRQKTWVSPVPAQPCDDASLDPGFDAALRNAPDCDLPVPQGSRQLMPGKPRQFGQNLLLVTQMRDRSFQFHHLCTH